MKRIAVVFIFMVFFIANIKKVRAGNCDCSPYRTETRGCGCQGNADCQGSMGSCDAWNHITSCSGGCCIEEWFNCPACFRPGTKVLVVKRKAKVSFAEKAIKKFQGWFLEVGKRFSGFSVRFP